jgi:DNA-binding response OmpR family regulator
LFHSYWKATPGTPGRSTILIVDDEPLNVDYLEQVLADFGYQTVSATNGQAALDHVAAAAPDLILLDVMMPVMDGFTVCRRLKAQEATRLIPIVMMTALDAVADRITGIKAGADDFLTKPVHEEALMARIATALTLKHTVDRRLGEFRALKAHVAQFVNLVMPPETPAS